MAIVGVSGQTIVTNALTILGINQQGANPSTSDSTAALNELNAMWDAWGIDDGLIWAVAPTTFSFTANTSPIALTSSVPRIFDAVWVPTNTPYLRIPLKMVDYKRFAEHVNQQAVTVYAPEEVYFDFLVGGGTSSSAFGSAYVWPIPSNAGTLEVWGGINFIAWILATVYYLPGGLQDAIQYALAYRLISQFGEIVAPSAQQRIAELAAKGEARFRQMNTVNRKLQPAEAVNPLVQQQAESPRPGGA